MSKLQTVQKIGPLLDLFTVDRHTWGVTEVAEAMSIPRSSTHALLISLVDVGLLQTRGKGRYSIGWRVLELGEVLRSRTDIRTIAAPIIEEHVREHKETTHLAVIERMTVLYIDKVIGTHNVVVQGARVGARLEAHCTAVGKLLLAYQDPANVQEFLRDRHLRRYTPTTITDVPELLHSLEEIRRSGVARDIGEQVPEIRCVAVPVRDEMGVVVAALSSSLPEGRFAAREMETTAALRRAADEIQRRLTASLEATGSGSHTLGVYEAAQSLNGRPAS